MQHTNVKSSRSIITSGFSLTIRGVIFFASPNLYFTGNQVLGGIYAGNISGITAQHLEWVYFSLSLSLSPENGEKNNTKVKLFLHLSESVLLILYISIWLIIDKLVFQELCTYGQRNCRNYQHAAYEKKWFKCGREKKARNWKDK